MGFTFLVLVVKGRKKKHPEVTVVGEPQKSPLKCLIIPYTPYSSGKRKQSNTIAFLHLSAPSVMSEHVISLNPPPQANEIISLKNGRQGRQIADCHMKKEKKVVLFFSPFLSCLDDRRGKPWGIVLKVSIVCVTLNTHSAPPHPTLPLLPTSPCPDVLCGIGSPRDAGMRSITGYPGATVQPIAAKLELGNTLLS